jgi:hypothetical protein
LVAEAIQVGEAEVGAGLTIGRGRGGDGTGFGGRGVEALDQLDGFAAGTVRTENLGKEGPEGDGPGVDALAAVKARDFGGQAGVGQESRSDVMELGQGVRVEGGAGLGEVIGGSLRAVEFTEERGGSEHSFVIYMYTYL